MQAIEAKLPHLITALPGPKAKQLVERDHRVLSPSYTRDYPLVAKKGHGAPFATVLTSMVPMVSGSLAPSCQSLTK